MLKTLVQSDSPLVTLYSSIRDELDQVEQLLTVELTSQHRFVNDLLTRSNRLSGKRLRPALLLLFGKAIGKLEDAHIKLAAAIEMVHTATLVHDDVLDSADQRRHSQTINCEFDNQTAILTGDFLFSHAFYLTSTLPSTYAAREIGQATNKVCEGEIRQIGTKQQFELAESEYIEIIDAKTAVLCSCAAKLGAYYAGGSHDQVNAAQSYGTNLGIAFQIVDDLLDLEGSESNTGKSLGTDLKQLKPTLPLIHHLNNLSQEDRQQTEKMLLADELSLDTILGRLKETESLDYSRAQAAKFAEMASEQTSHLGDNEVARILHDLPEFVLRRNM